MRTSPRPSFPVAALVVLLAVSPPLTARQRDSGDGDQHAEQIETVTRTVRLAPGGEIDLSNVAGDIAIAGGDGDQVRIEAVKRARARTADAARQHLAMVEVQVTDRPGRVEVRTAQPRSGRDVDVTVSYTVTVPVSTRTLVRSVSGDIRLRGTTGDARLETVSGEIQVDARVKVATLRSVSGSVQAARLAPDARLLVSLVSGNLTLDNLEAQAVEAETVSGDITLRSVVAQRVSAEAVSGDLTYSGSLAKGGRYELTTHSGDVTLTIPGTVGFELTATTFSGDVNNALPLPGQTGGEQQPGPRQRTVRGTYGDGSAVLDLTTFSGDIEIRKG